MDRQQVADALEEIGLLPELRGENPFETRADGNAARVLRTMSEDLDQLIQSRQVSRIQGVGSALAEKIETLVMPGGLPYLDPLRAETPAGLLEWLRIPGLGPKKARAIWLGLGITQTDDLDRACREGRVHRLDGFAETSEGKILEGIERLRSQAGRFLQPVVQAAAARLEWLTARRAPAPGRGGCRGGA